MEGIAIIGQVWVGKWAQEKEAFLLTVKCSPTNGFGINPPQILHLKVGLSSPKFMRMRTCRSWKLGKVRKYFVLFCFVLFLRVRKKEIQKKCPSARVARSMFSTQKNARKSTILNSNDFMLITRKNSSINCFQYVSFLEHYLATLVFPSFAFQVSRSEVFLIPPFLSSIIFTSVFFQGARVKLI